MKWLLLFVILILKVGCKEERKEVPLPSLGFHKTVLTSSKEGKKLWRLVCDEVRMEEGKTYLSKIALELYKDDRSCKIVADNGILDQEKGRIELFGKVEAEGPEKVKLQTERLIWDEKERRLTTESKIILEEEGIILSGRGFIAEADFSSVKIKNGVRVKFK